MDQDTIKDRRSFLKKCMMGFGAALLGFASLKTALAGDTTVLNTGITTDSMIAGTKRTVPVDHTPGVAGTATLNLSEGVVHDIVMPAGNITIAISNEVDGHIFTVRILQDGTGSRTVTWFSTIKWAGGSAPTLTTTADKADMFIFRCTGTDTYDGFIIGQDI